MSETATATTADPAVKTYRGETIEELLPQIREELGPDAVVLRQREGLTGGVGGFFQRRCVEVEARAVATGGLDVYDEPAMPEPGLMRNDAATREGLATPEMRAAVEQAQPFAALLDELAPEHAPSRVVTTPAEAPTPPPVPADAPFAPPVAPPARAEAPSTPPALPRAAKVRNELVASGLGEDLAAGIVDAVVASTLPFATPGRLRTLVREELALRIPRAAAAAPGPRALAVVGPAGSGKTAAVAAIAAVHASAGHDVICMSLAPADGGASLDAMLADSGLRATVIDTKGPGEALAARMAGALVVIDTPAAFAGGPSLAPLARQLRAIGIDEVHLALRAGTGRHAASELIDGLAGLRPSRLLLTAAGETGHPGGAIDAALRTGLALGYVADGPQALAPADPRALAKKVLA
jgi:flagellar biosynthesis GTPase FlhF